MRNFVQESYSIDIIAPKKLKAGEPFAMGNIISIPQDDAEEGSLVTVFTEGIFILNVSENTSIGQALYFHDSNGVIDTKSSNSIFCGFSVDNKAAGPIRVMLNKCLVSSGSVDLTQYMKIVDFKKNLIASVADNDVIKAFKLDTPK